MCIFYKITYLILFVCLINVKILCSAGWNEVHKISDSELEDDSIPKTECPEEFQSFCNKEYSDLDNPYGRFFENNKDHRSKDKRTSISPMYDTINRVPCQCEMTYRLMDLGKGIYPRYIHTGVCKKNTCGLFHRCQPKRYKVRLLKRRDSDVSISEDFHELDESHLPESLAEEWISDHVNIVIACECIPIKI